MGGSLLPSAPRLHRWEKRAWHWQRRAHRQRSAADVAGQRAAASHAASHLLVPAHSRLPHISGVQMGAWVVEEQHVRKGSVPMDEHWRAGAATLRHSSHATCHHLGAPPRACRSKLSMTRSPLVEPPRCRRPRPCRPRRAALVAIAFAPPPSPSPLPLPPSPSRSPLRLSTPRTRTPPPPLVEPPRDASLVPASDI